MQISIPAFSRSPYAILVLTSVAIGFLVAVLLMRKFEIKKQTVIYTCLLTFVSTLTISLALAFKITPDGLEYGFSGLGAVIGMISGVFISCIIFKDRSDCVMASFVAAAPLMYGLAKTGCLLAGCCHGKEYNGPLAVVYHGDNSGSYFPAQIIDMAAFILLFFLALLLVLKMKNKVKAVYIILAVVIPVRYALEYLRFYHEGGIIASGQVKVLAAGAVAIIIITVWQKICKPGRQQA